MLMMYIVIKKNETFVQTAFLKDEGFFFQNICLVNTNKKTIPNENSSYICDTKNAGS